MNAKWQVPCTHENNLILVLLISSAIALYYCKQDLEVPDRNLQGFRTHLVLPVLRLFQLQALQQGIVE